MATFTEWVYLPADDSDDPMHYYANLTTGESQWDRPRVLDANCGSASAAGASSSEIIRRMEASISSIVGSWD
jgi:hypothetical protein